MSGICKFCDLGWPLSIPISKSVEPRHPYPPDYKGQRAGFGPYCDRLRSVWDEKERRWVHAETKEGR